MRHPLWRWGAGSLPPLLGSNLVLVSTGIPLEPRAQQLHLLLPGLLGGPGDLVAALGVARRPDALEQPPVVLEPLVDRRQVLLRTSGPGTIKFSHELSSFKENWNQVLCVSLLMTSSTALANKWLFELSRRPPLT